MTHGICTLSLVPCRAEPNDRSEMITQLIFGETVKVLIEKEKWLKIQCFDDKYSGWIDRQQLTSITQKEFKRLTNNDLVVSEDLLSPIKELNRNQIFPITFGAKLPGINDNNTFSIADKEFEFLGHSRKIDKKVERKKIIEDAFLMLNSPYLWGGVSPFGIDCSGFTQLIYALNGTTIPRDAYQQAELGQALSFIEEAEEGNLAFFDNEEGKIIHVGIMLNNHRIIHASGCVRIDRMDHQGIYRDESKDYSHKLRIIKKII